MEPIGFYASERHYVDHLAPIWDALEVDERAWFVCGSQQATDRARALGIDAHLDRKARRRRIGHTVVAAFNDLRHFGRQRVVFVEHGAGQTYPIGEAAHSHYSGGKNRQAADLFICPNVVVAEANQLAYPNTPAVAVGSPRLDRWADIPILPTKNGQPVIAVSFHFEAKLAVPEARWAFPHFASAVATLQQRTGWKVLGHGHPRALSQLSGFYEQNEIEIVRNFDEILERAHLYVCDNSSTIFEFAALDRPVVLLDAPWYRPGIHHGLRFWEFADVGYRIQNPDDLVEAVKQGWLIDPPIFRDRRREVSRLLFGPLDGKASARAAQAMRDHLP